MKPSELLLPYTEWKALPKPTNADFQAWLRAWELYDLAVGVRRDEERRFVRYGHYLGWFAAVRDGEGVNGNAG